MYTAEVFPGWIEGPGWLLRVLADHSSVRSPHEDAISSTVHHVPPLLSIIVETASVLARGEFLFNASFHFNSFAAIRAIFFNTASPGS